MPVGAAIGGAAIAGVGAIGAGALGAGAQRDAAQTAANTTLQQTQLNNELFRQTRDQNLSIASPFYNNGLLAGNALTDLLLGTHTYNPAIVANPTTPGGGTFSQFPTPGSTGAGSGYGGPLLAEIMAMKNDGVPGNYAAAMGALNGWRSAHPGVDPFTPSAPSGALASYNPSPAQSAPVVSQTPVGAPAMQAARPIRTDYRGDPSGYRDAMQTYRDPTSASAAAAPGTANGALSAWDQFREGTNYQWRLGQGLGALNQSYAANGVFDSGAADKARIKFGQNFASNELSNYMNLLASQQAAGLSAAGAAMGVGTSYAGNVAAGNTAAANAAANAALANGQATAGMWGSIGQGVGQLGGALFQYGMRPQPQMAFPSPDLSRSGYDLPPVSAPTYLPGGFG